MQYLILDVEKREARLIPEWLAEQMGAEDLEGMEALEVEDDFAWETHAVNWETLTVVQDISPLRAAKWSEVKALRDKLEDGNAPTPFGLVQCDDRSKVKISGLVQMALIATQAEQPFEESFTLADNSIIELTAQMAVGLGVAVGHHVSALHASARALRAAIEAAETVEELNAIDIEAGWPTSQFTLAQLIGKE